MITNLICRTTQRLLGRRPRCDKVRISRPRFLDQDTYIERCVLEAHHRGDHVPGPRVPSGAAAALTQHDQEHGLYDHETTTAGR